MAVSAFYLSDSNSHRDRVVAQINITPLVDVLLVLLVIFMVATPALTGQLQLRLPQATPQRITQQPPPTIELRVQSDGSYLLAGMPVTDSELSAALKAHAQANPRTVLRIAGDADAQYQSFATALSEAQHSGLRDIAWE